MTGHEAWPRFPSEITATMHLVGDANESEEKPEADRRGSADQCDLGPEGEWIGCQLDHATMLAGDPARRNGVDDLGEAPYGYAGKGKMPDEKHEDRPLREIVFHV